MISVLSDQGDQLGTTDGGNIPGGDMGRPMKVRKDLGQLYQPKGGKVGILRLCHTKVL